MEKQETISMIFLTASIIMCIVSICVLPDPVITQISVGGNTMSPKYVAIAIPALLGLGGSIYSFVLADSSTYTKGVMISAIGLALFVVMLAVNH